MDSQSYYYYYKHDTTDGRDRDPYHVPYSMKQILASRFSSILLHPMSTMRNVTSPQHKQGGKTRYSC